MIIEINEELFKKVKEIIKGRNLSIYEELEKLTPFDPVATITTDTTLQQARDIKTQRIKQSIKETIKSLYIQDTRVSKYKIHKRTGIAYVTINKYYDDILEEFKR